MIKTTSLELSKQLKEAGFPQHKSAFCWGVWGFNKYNLDQEIPKGDQEAELFDGEYSNFGEGASRIADAPMTEEILDELPACTITYSKKWIGIFILGKDDGSEVSLAEAAGNIYLRLKKEGLI